MVWPVGLCLPRRRHVLCRNIGTGMKLHTSYLGKRNGQKVVEGCWGYRRKRDLSLFLKERLSSFYKERRVWLRETRSCIAFKRLLDPACHKIQCNPTTVLSCSLCHRSAALYQQGLHFGQRTMGSRLPHWVPKVCLCLLLTWSPFCWPLKETR